MTVSAVSKISNLIGEVLEGDKSTGRECIGHFACVSICLDVRQPLMCGTLVASSREEALWVDFQESNQSCENLSTEEKKEIASGGRNTNTQLFLGLEALEDLRAGTNQKRGIDGQEEDKGDQMEKAASIIRLRMVTMSGDVHRVQQAMKL
ncbi:unnamed protein product [Prunus armeniaca]|uniref:Uncharacterized protein n=1 Tax=Prunus armeniaca TaxID=36596 RepID=A0A6J5U216_PRUAR|nr:unnamed protein product [Prunus armeniaca]